MSAGPILITGGAGFLGTNLAHRLIVDGRQVTILDNLGRPGVEQNVRWLRQHHPGKLRLLTGDVRDPAVLAEAVRDASAVMHLAAQVAVTSSVDDPVNDFEINAAGTLQLLEIMRRRADPPPLIFASTNKVYGQLLGDAALVRRPSRWQPAETSKLIGCDETTPLDFHSPYGCSKGVADQYVHDYARVFGLRTLVFRMSCLYGPHQRGTEDQGWVAHFLIQARRGLPITIFGDGAQVRDVLFVDDAVEAWLVGLREIDRLSGRVFNLGGGPRNTLSLRELLAAMERLSGDRPAVRYKDWRPGDQRWYVSDTRAFEVATGWSAKVDPETGLRRLAAWLEAEQPLEPGAAAA